jgi:hypothetical protein
MIGLMPREQVVDEVALQCLFTINGVEVIDRNRQGGSGGPPLTVFARVTHV